MICLILVLNTLIAVRSDIQQSNCYLFVEFLMDDSMTQTLFFPLRLGSLDLKHRVVMAPLTRMRAAQPGNIPHALNVEYYRQRASQGGLIISEGSQISRTGQGMPATPGIHSEEQIAGWKAVTEAVHSQGGLIFLQLWHVGRISHSSLLGGQLPVAPSAIAAPGNAFTASFERAPFETPRALETAEIASVIEEYAQAARHAQQAGFDGVEIHAANGYLWSSFCRAGATSEPMPMVARLRIAAASCWRLPRRSQPFSGLIVSASGYRHSGWLTVVARMIHCLSIRT